MVTFEDDIQILCVVELSELVTFAHTKSLYPALYWYPPPTVTLTFFTPIRYETAVTTVVLMLVGAVLYSGFEARNMRLGSGYLAVQRG